MMAVKTCPKCGYRFSGPGEFRREMVRIRLDGTEEVECPTCRSTYIQSRE